jgi:hypothetical protein
MADHLDEQLGRKAITKIVAMQPDDVAETCTNLAHGAGRI